MKKFKELRKHMLEAEINQLDLAAKLHKSAVSLSNRLNGKVPFSIDDAYDIMKILEIPVEQMPLYFPDRRA